MDIGLTDHSVWVVGAGKLADDCRHALSAEGARIIDTPANDTPPDAVVYIAPPTPQVDVEHLSHEDAIAAWDNVEGLAAAFSSVLPGMTARKSGRLVWLGPLSAKTLGDANDTNDVISGLGALGLIKAIAGEYGPHNITCNAVLYDDPAHASITETAAFLVSDAASYVTGVAIAVDGGASAGAF